MHCFIDSCLTLCTSVPPTAGNNRKCKRMHKNILQYGYNTKYKARL